MHGHNPVDVSSIDAQVLIIAHEHPAVVIRDEAGNRERVPCFLYGRFGEVEVVCLPAMTPFGGSEVNVSPRHLLSPVLRELDVDSMTPIVCVGSSVLRLPPVGSLLL